MLTCMGLNRHTFFTCAEIQYYSWALHHFEDPVLSYHVCLKPSRQHVMVTVVESTFETRSYACSYLIKYRYILYQDFRQHNIINNYCHLVVLCNTDHCMHAAATMDNLSLPCGLVCAVYTIIHTIIYLKSKIERWDAWITWITCRGHVDYRVVKITTHKLLVFTPYIPDW